MDGVQTRTDCGPGGALPAEQELVELDVEGGEHHQTCDCRARPAAQDASADRTAAAALTRWRQPRFRASRRRIGAVARARPTGRRAARSRCAPCRRASSASGACPGAAGRGRSFRRSPSAVCPGRCPRRTEARSARRRILRCAKRVGRYAPVRPRTSSPRLPLLVHVMVEEVPELRDDARIRGLVVVGPNTAVSSGSAANASRTRECVAMRQHVGVDEDDDLPSRRRHRHCGPQPGRSRP